MITFIYEYDDELSIKVHGFYNVYLSGGILFNFCSEYNNLCGEVHTGKSLWVEPTSKSVGSAWWHSRKKYGFDRYEDAIIYAAEHGLCDEGITYFLESNINMDEAVISAAKGWLLHEIYFSRHTWAEGGR